MQFDVTRSLYVSNSISQSRDRVSRLWMLLGFSTIDLACLDFFGLLNSLTALTNLISIPFTDAVFSACMVWCMCGHELAYVSIQLSIWSRRHAYSVDNHDQLK